MKTLPILYKKTNTGAIQYWKIDVRRGQAPANNKYKTNSYWIIIEYGQEGTDKPQYSNELIKEGKNIGKKNETTAEQQAWKEAESRWKKQKKTGYTENKNEAATGEIGAFVQAGIKPMLAKNFNDFKDKVIYPAIIDRKYNGGRVIVKKEGCFTRKGERYKTIPHIEESTKGFFELYPNALLDGEGYNHEYRYKLNEIMKILRKTKNITEEDLKLSKEKIKFYVYDGYGFNGITEKSPLLDRRIILKKLLKNIKCIEIVDGEIINSENELLIKYQEYLEDGYEGAMYRDMNSPYENKRSKHLLKIKPEDDDEGIIKEIILGTGVWQNGGKKITLDWNGEEVGATFKGSIEECEKFYKDRDKWIGKKVTFIYNGLTGLGIPNYARLDYNNCLKH